MTQPEARLQRRIQDALKRRDAFVFKIHGSAHMMAGLPDLIICYRGQFIGMEVKMVGNDASPIQRLRHREIEHAGGMAKVVRSPDEALAILDEIDISIEPES